MLNKGLVTVTASPGEKGEMANIECVPASSYYTVTNETQSRTPSAGRSVFPGIGCRMVIM